MASQVALTQGGIGVTVPPANADATGHYIVPGTAKKISLRFANTSGSIVTLTFDDVNSAGPEGATQFNPDVPVALPATTGVRYVVLSGARLARFLNSSNGRVAWTYSAATGVTVEAMVVG
jgi:hypothetical protein